MSEHSESVARRIRALLEKTTANGCTEEEAITAAAKARELMDRHRITMTDVEIKAEPISTEILDRANQLRFAPVDYCTNGIRKYCGVRMWFQKERTRRLVIFGLKPDVEMARYLYEMISSVITETELRWEKTDEYRNAPNRRAAPASFRLGMASRINERLLQMAKNLEPVAKTATGTALVVVKNAAVEAAYAQLNLKMGKTSMGSSIRSDGGFRAGREAGDRVSLSRPLHGKQERIS